MILFLQIGDISSSEVVFYGVLFLLNPNIIFRNFCSPKTTQVHFANFIYAHSACFCLLLVNTNYRIIVQKCMPLQLEGRICKQKWFSPSAESLSSRVNVRLSLLIILRYNFITIIS